MKNQLKSFNVVKKYKNNNNKFGKTFFCNFILVFFMNFIEVLAHFKKLKNCKILRIRLKFRKITYFVFIVVSKFGIKQNKTKIEEGEKIDYRIVNSNKESIEM